MLENAGNRHSDFAKDSVIEGSTAGKAWILTDWKVSVEFYPKYAQKLQVQTWIEKLNSPFGSIRDFVLLADGKVCAKAVSKWVLFDMKSKRLAKIEPILVESYKSEEKTVFENSRFEKISLPKERYGTALYKSLRISYKTALTENDKAVCKYKTCNGSDTIAIFNANEELCCLVELYENW